MELRQGKLKELEKEVKRLKAKLSETRTSQESELKRVKIQLAEKTMALDAMETLVDIASKHYKADIKKNFGRQQ